MASIKATRNDLAEFQIHNQRAGLLTEPVREHASGILFFSRSHKTQIHSCCHDGCSVPVLIWFLSKTNEIISFIQNKLNQIQN